MEAIRDKMTNLKNAKEAAADMEKSLQNRIAELNKILEERDHEIIIIGKKIMKIENSLDDTTEKLEAATLGLGKLRSSSWSMRRKCPPSNVDPPCSMTMSPDPKAVFKLRAPSSPRPPRPRKPWRFSARFSRPSPSSMTSAWTPLRKTSPSPVTSPSSPPETPRRSPENLP